MCKKEGCHHSQCPFPEQSGYNCVEIVGGYCEIGQNCVKQCQFSYSKRKTVHAIEAFKQKYPQLHCTNFH